MKTFLVAFVLALNVYAATAQKSYLDSLKEVLNNQPNEDTSQVLALFPVADYYGFLQFNTCFRYALRISQLSEKLNYPYGRFLGYFTTFHALNSQGNYSKALEVLLNMKKIAEEIKTERPWTTAQLDYFLGLLNREMSNYDEAKAWFMQSIAWQKKTGEPMEEVFATYSQLGMLYSKMNQSDSALIYAQKGYELGLHAKQFKIYFPLAIGALGNINADSRKFAEAGQFFREAIKESSIYDNVYFEAKNYNNLASLFDKMNLRDSCIYYAGISLRLSTEHNFADFALDASKILANSYELLNNRDSAFKYLKIMLAAKDSVFSQQKVQQFEQKAFTEMQRQQEAGIAKERYQNQVRVYSLIASLVVFLLLAFILYHNNRQKQKAKNNIEKAYIDLKSTQSQLIQSEKMASLGELTAGIAHEIQNPLNFVNNFSEVNTELIEELQQEIDKGNMEDVKAIAVNIKENEEKINHHGKRADAIVKGMLQHSRASSSQKELTDINALADEYLRLCYHGIRAKDKNFNATMKTDFDDSIGKINIVPQDIGRVILNLLTNAFYAVGPRARDKENKDPQTKYEPTVWVSTKKMGDKVEIKVADNGVGIPQNIIDKIFQPFFTTKPTGQGTGLGLSLSYDIIKAHGGELKVETKEGEGTTFFIKLPVA